ncbi:hypothetical protein QR680_007953 [Steinernema hermaphroditum]|uniref:Uncharacterized protein n=1 Tax=Steinernema hermaphroditum TaxID=289476 RepID=A0AA39M657_9BILA|nr:hypothetical protein QR680_007953 [Steinernema hermaphroditum]
MACMDSVNRYNTIACLITTWILWALVATGLVTAFVLVFHKKDDPLLSIFSVIVLVSVAFFGLGFQVLATHVVIYEQDVERRIFIELLLYIFYQAYAIGVELVFVIICAMSVSPLAFASFLVLIVQFVTMIYMCFYVRYIYALHAGFLQLGRLAPLVLAALRRGQRLFNAEKALGWKRNIPPEPSRNRASEGLYDEIQI